MFSVCKGHVSNVLCSFYSDIASFLKAVEPLRALLLSLEDMCANLLNLIFGSHLLQESIFINLF
jgi:hypothetical protein